VNAPRRVGILPAHEHRARPRLWRALEAAYPVRFEGREPGALRELDALIAVGDVGAQGESAGAKGQFAGAKGQFAGAKGQFAGAKRQFAGAKGQSPGSLPCLPASSGEERTDACMGAAAHLPAELQEGEALRERLRPGRHRALLTLARFLRDLTARGPAPPLRAAFVIDDPNLRRARYGHVDYEVLLRDARAHGYHVSIATVPLDGRLAHPRAVRIFREGRAHLSLCIHGNDHDGPELGRPRSDSRALALVAQAVRRTMAFERRTGLAVDRVMVPPHERLSEPVARALCTCGFQAIATTRPYPWLADTLNRSWLERPADAGPLVGWRPFDVVAGDLPVLLRADFEHHPREDLALRAFLGQPLILYGHHDLLAEGPDALAQAAAEIDRLGDVQWCRLGAIAPARPALDQQTLAAIPRPPRRLTPTLRRALSEGRDRAGALRPARGV
jgi:hypothetical protein